MTPRSARRAAWGLCVVTMGLLAASLVGDVMADGVPEAGSVSNLLLVVLSTVGAFVAARHPGNVIGWLFLGSALLLSAAEASYRYADVALDNGTSSTSGVLAAWLASWSFLPALFGVPSLLFLLFPDGRPLTGRWRPVVWLTGACVVSMALGGALRPGPMEDTPVSGLDNPFGVPGPLPDMLGWFGWYGGFVLVVLATTSLVLRYRRATGEERLQLRWFTAAGVVFMTLFLAAGAFWALGQLLVIPVLVIVGFSTLPITAGIAILRYRLYDIDVVINRTLVYSALTLALVGTYLLSVLVLQTILRPVAGESDLAVAASTLAVAALFRPLRARIQEVVDRRFYRRRYDATRTLEAFTGRLRQEVDLQTTASDLRSVVRETMQPDHVSLWLRQEVPR